jgi:F5/8 type C domain
MLATALLALLSAHATTAAPRIWLDHTDVPVALKASNDTGNEIKGCKAEWAMKWDRDRHYTEVALVDLPAKGEVTVSDCHDWWNPSWSRTMDVTVTLYGPDGKALDKQAYEGIFKLVPRTGLPTDGWRAAAIRGDASLAFDGKLETRWDTGRKQEVGDWYTLDMGKPQRIAGLTLDSRASANDYPSGLAVFTSADGMKWTRLAEIGDTEPINRAGRLDISFDPIDARYINLLLTRTHGDTWFWSIHELSVLPAK